MTEQEYKETFKALGRTLQPGDGVPDAAIEEAQAKLGRRIPAALRAFYRAAGQATDFTDNYDHFLLPSKWSIEDGKLVFLAENQSVVLYAIDTLVEDDDPPVLMTSNEEPFVFKVWNEVCGRCSEFLDVMIHWEGAFGGAMPFGGSAVVDANFRQVLERDFHARGLVNGMRAYTGQGLAICFMQWSDGWRIFVGATQENMLAHITELGVKLEMNDF